jgi:hypothetical protein
MQRFYSLWWVKGIEQPFRLRQTRNPGRRRPVLQRIVRRIPVSPRGMQHTPATSITSDRIMSNRYMSACAAGAGKC